ncbi:peptide chain release factor N(5)-glutamine methyltransferase [Candidatus Falkowbacteria bacterium]|nr:peptide chain release factor N(5)-glutamine methyltransferase [Candidatus Falkowbacteria bacterium]
MTIAQSLKLAVGKLSAEKINLPHLEAEILLSAVLKKPREFILAHGEAGLTKPQIANFKSQIKKRLKGLPIAYLTGAKEFYGLDFIVNKNVLIPRPETELMVEEVLNFTPRGSRPAAFIDVGTGSGCIIIALAKQNINGKLFAIDISAKALTVAKQNARTHNVHKKIKFLKGDLLSPLIHNSAFKTADSDLIITANLPYGWKAWKNNCSMNTVGLKFEPQIALYAGKNGLELYEKLFKQINYLIYNTKYKIQNTIMLCEIDPRQTAKIKQLVKRELPEATCQIKKDLSGLDRLAIIKSINQSSIKILRRIAVRRRLGPV